MSQTFHDTVFLAAIDARRISEGLSWRQLGKKLNLSPSTFSRLSRGRRPDVETFVRLLAWLEMPADSFMKEGSVPTETPAGKNALMAISNALRSDPAIPTDGLEAMEQLFRVVYKNVIATSAAPHIKRVKSRSRSKGGR